MNQVDFPMSYLQETDVIMRLSPPPPFSRRDETGGEEGFFLVKSETPGDDECHGGHEARVRRWWRTIRAGRRCSSS